MFLLKANKFFLFLTVINLTIALLGLSFYHSYAQPNNFYCVTFTPSPVRTLNPIFLTATNARSSTPVTISFYQTYKVVSVNGVNTRISPSTNAFKSGSLAFGETIVMSNEIFTDSLYNWRKTAYTNQWIAISSRSGQVYLEVVP